MNDAPSLVLTRPVGTAHRFASDLRRVGVEWRILFAPVLRIVYLDVSLPRVGTLLFTSENGVKAAGDLTGRIALAVGDRTAAMATAAGATCQSADGDVEDLFHLARAHPDLAPFVHVHGLHTAGSLGARLRAAGCDTEDHIAYDQQDRALSDAAMTVFRRGGPCIVPLFSPRSARGLRRQIASGSDENMHVLALSAAVGDAWEGPARIAARPNAQAMRDELRELYEAGLVGRKTGR